MIYTWSYLHTQRHTLEQNTRGDIDTGWDALGRVIYTERHTYGGETRRDIFTKETYIHTDINYGEDIHLERHTYTRKRHIHKRTNKGTHTEEHTYKRPYTRRNIHTEGRIH